MRYVSLFSGIEAATCAWEPLGWEPVAFSEIEPFPCAVLQHHYPEVPNLGDVTKIDWSDFLGRNERPDLLVGGSPCQSFSIAGGRESLEGESRLMFEYIRAAAELRPRWLVWENVPGALSAKGLQGERGGAYQCLLRELCQLGYGLCWRVLDAQFFGVAQRRRRVFLVGCLGDAGRAAEVLFEPDCLRGDNPPSREKRKELAAAAGAGAPKASTLVVRCGCKGGGKGALVSEELSMTLSTSNTQTLVQEPLGFKYHQGAGAGSIGCEEGISPTCTADYHNPAVCIPINEMVATRGNALGRGTGFGVGSDGDPANTLSRAHPHAVATFPIQGNVVGRSDGNDPGGSGYQESGEPMFTLNCADLHCICMADDNAKAAIDDDMCGSLKIGGSAPVVAPQEAIVRRLMPVEYERLQGFPDGYTDIEFRGKPASDTARYKALGNSMAVPCMRWIGERIAMVEGER